MEYLKDTEHELSKVVDGWIAYADEDDKWREVSIFNPNLHIKFVEEIHHPKMEDLDMYPNFDQDQQNLEKAYIGKFITSKFKIIGSEKQLTSVPNFDFRSD